MSETRERAIKLVATYDGVSVSSDRARYVGLLGPGETKAMQDYFCDPKTSGCALTIRGLWRELGCTDKRVMPSYVFGKAVTWLVAIAKERGGWVAASSGNLPQAGDFVLVGGDKTKDGGVEHVFTVLTASVDGDGAILSSIDGGQRDDKGQQAILEKKRRWSLRSGAYWDVSSHGSDPGSNAPGGRRVIGWGNIERILAEG